ncbi:MAG: bifunctional diaminohydroxyphosphoribosylaminopyrimidine deaminase/5-amino-6-(5-phosphoribosylamino)uracil reductase RibD [Cetobacterium sp.]|uniref:bifunctional diaminohydroxyphosphoribosylaminopyrimidine deaminase/5-amino-6-(5-phosphoribosylamino)uracil reductase RibD n=1 Tax=Cetobacterium sp. TaxID=2071632 RepID=UPI003F3BDF64
MTIDEKYMALALEEAAKGLGKTNPNPMVGALVVKNDEIISAGFHEIYGSHHAEVNALNKAGEKAQGATIYVTLEPCSHHGKTPPCVDKIIQCGIKKCVVATLDPNPLVAGRGIKILQEAGIEVTIGVLEKEAKLLNEVFFQYIVDKNPYIFLKCAITLDGKIATKNFSSKWITNSLAREKVQYYRNKFMGIFVGTNTVLEDNPGLRCGLENGRDPYRITIDKNLKIPVTHKIISHNQDEKTIFAVHSSMVNSEKYNLLKDKYKIKFIIFSQEKISLENLFREVGKFSIDSILVEGGCEIISQVFEENLFHGGEIFLAPKILGDSNSIPFISGFNRNSIEEAINLKNISYEIYGDNIGIKFKNK